MCAFVDDLILHTRQSVEDDCSSSTFHIVDRGLAEREEKCGWNGPPAYIVQHTGSSHLGRLDGAVIVK